MTNRVRSAFKRLISIPRSPTINEVDGYKNFIFINHSGHPKIAKNYNKLFERLAKAYNQASEIPLPEIFTPHTLRHTFCTNMANAGMNPKTLQYIMGHSDINMTLNYYTHITLDSAKSEMERLGLV